MTHEAEKTEEDLEQLRRRLEEFRRARTRKGALPEPFWQEAVQAARRHGVNQTAKVLRLAYSGLKMRMEGTHHPKRKAKAAPLPTFVEFVGAAVGVATGCTIEVEAAQGGKLRLDLKAVTTTELANLIRTFMGR